MNKRVMKSMVALLWGFLACFAVMKFFYPEELIAVVTNEKIIAIGNFIDSNLWAKIGANALISMLSAHFYFCSCKQVWRLSVGQYAIVLLYVAVGIVCSLLNITLYTIIDLLLLLSISFIFKSNPVQAVTIFVLNVLAQLAVLLIRSEPLYLVSTNYATSLLLFFDAQLWLLLYYLYSNMYKEETLWESLFSHFSVIRRKKNSEKNSKE